MSGSGSSAAYHLLGQSSTDPETELDDHEAEPDATEIKMGQRLGTFRAVYVVALCCIGSFLFAYVRECAMPQNPLLTSSGYRHCWWCSNPEVVPARLPIHERRKDASQFELRFYPPSWRLLWLFPRLASHF